MIYAGRVENAASPSAGNLHITQIPARRAWCPPDCPPCSALRLLSPEDYAKLPDVSEA